MKATKIQSLQEANALTKPCFNIFPVNGVSFSVNSHGILSIIADGLRMPHEEIHTLVKGITKDELRQGKLHEKIAKLVYAESITALFEELIQNSVESQE